MRNKLSTITNLKDKDPQAHHTWTNEYKASSEEDMKTFISGLNGAMRHWEVLNRILLKMYESKQNSNFSFDTPNWMEKEIFNKGYLKALDDIYKIIPKTKEE